MINLLMFSSSSSAEPEVLISGVFAFLDSVLSLEQRELAGRADLTKVRSYEKDWWGCTEESIDIWVQRLIHESFRLQYLDCPLRKALHPFRLYYREDMADALTHAYFLRVRGDDPSKALGGDYVLKPHGLLYWMGWEQMEAGDTYEKKVRNEFFRYREEGDRILRYRTFVNSGYLLVRGDRLVWHLPGDHYTVIGRSSRFEAECQEFERLGGNRSFLEGSFTWPPEGWVNPAANGNGSW